MNQLIPRLLGKETPKFSLRTEMEKKILKDKILLSAMFYSKLQMRKIFMSLGKMLLLIPLKGTRLMRLLKATPEKQTGLSSHLKCLRSA